MGVKRREKREKKSVCVKSEKESGYSERRGEKERRKRKKKQ